MTRAARLAAAAAALAGTPFRLHGRDPAYGLDCLGLVLVALEAAGSPVRGTTAYTLRLTGIAPLLPLADAARLAPAAGPSAPGDILLLRPGPAQYHLAIALAGGAVVHAHAGLGRVVVQPGPLPWPLLHHWRAS